MRIVIVRLKYISNFTDFDPFYHEPDVDVLFSANPSDIENADLVIIPGTKNTVKDLLFLRERGLDRAVKNAAGKGVRIMGMCGGYQMLGKKIYDPHGVESPEPEVEGIGLLDIETTFATGKRTCRVEAAMTKSAFGEKADHIDDCANHYPENYSLKGYEIHMGESSGDVGLFRIRRISSSLNADNRTEGYVLDGSRKSNCWGTYIHGIFDNDLFRRDLINSLRDREGIAAAGALLQLCGDQRKEQSIVLLPW